MPQITIQAERDVDRPRPVAEGPVLAGSHQAKFRYLLNLAGRSIRDLVASGKLF
jgi:hypothetical protein